MTWEFVLISINCIFIILNTFAYAMVKFNDLRHLANDVEELKEMNEKSLDRIFRRLGKIEKDIVKREAICFERHPKK